MKKTSNSEDNIILISKKAYDDFATRIRQTLDAIATSFETIDKAVALFDRYAKGEVIDLENEDILVKLTLMMLKPEIDKAMRRSSAARERARRRRDKSISEIAPTTGETFTASDTPISSPSNPASEVSAIIELPTSSVEYPMNRRERREYERELAREERRYERRKRRFLNAKHCAGGNSKNKA